MPTATERLFFAVRPDALTAQRIEALVQALRREYGFRGKSLGPERFHVTLHLIGTFTGSIPASVVSRAVEAARPVAANASAFHVGFDTVASFTRKRRNMPLVLLGGDGVLSIARLQQTLLAALTSASLASHPEAGFTPHLTLLYDDIPLAPLPIDALIWRVDELLLIRSLVGLGRHEVLERFPLGT